MNDQKRTRAKADLIAFAIGKIRSKETNMPTLTFKPRYTFSVDLLIVNIQSALYTKTGLAEETMEYTDQRKFLARRICAESLVGLIHHGPPTELRHVVAIYSVWMNRSLMVYSGSAD